MSARENRIKLIREAGIEIADGTPTGIVAIVVPGTAREIEAEIKKDGPSENIVARITLDNGLGYLEKDYRTPPNTNSMALYTPDPDRAVRLLKGKVPYVEVLVPLPNKPQPDYGAKFEKAFRGITANRLN